MSFTICPHCAANTPVGSFCQSCGKAIESAASAPRVVKGADIAKTSAGATLQSEQLEKQVRSASGALLAVAILSLLGLGLLWFMLQQMGPQVDWDIATILLAAQAAISVIFFGLWIWSKSSPLPAAIVGLVVYLSLILVNAFMDPATIAQGLIVKIIIIAFLCKGISAGLQHRKLLESHSGY